MHSPRGVKKAAYRRECEYYPPTCPPTVSQGAVRDVPAYPHLPGKTKAPSCQGRDVSTAPRSCASQGRCRYLSDDARHSADQTLCESARQAVPRTCHGLAGYSRGARRHAAEGARGRAVAVHTPAARQRSRVPTPHRRAAQTLEVATAADRRRYRSRHQALRPSAPAQPSTRTLRGGENACAGRVRATQAPPRARQRLEACSAEV
eukprot:PRCOL_00006398-RA